MTPNEQQALKDSQNKTATIILLLIIVGAYTAVYFYEHFFATSIQNTKPVNNPVTDQNQTRADLIQTINDQRARVFASYATEYYFCKNHLNKDIRGSDITDIQITGITTKATVECDAMDGTAQKYLVSYNDETHAYNETIIFS